MVLSEKVEFLSTFILPVLNEEIFQNYKYCQFLPVLSTLYALYCSLLWIQIMVRQKFIG